MTVRTKLLGLASASVLALGVGAPAASAAHCTDEGPDHSYFGTEHVQESNHNEGVHKGYSSCNPSESNPSKRSSNGNGGGKSDDGSRGKSGR